jgi:hypothetical protein
MANRGSVRFAPAAGALGTEVRVQIDYRPPAGTLGRTVAWLAGHDPKERLRQGMARLKRVIAIDRFDYRLDMARQQGRAETVNYETTSVHEALEEMTGGRGPDPCIAAVGTAWRPTAPAWPAPATR